MAASSADPDPGRVAEVLVTLTGEPGVSRRGSGYLVADGFVLSAAHVVDGAAIVAVRFNADQPAQWSSLASVVWRDRSADLVVLRLNEQPEQVVVDTVRIGWVPIRPVRVDAVALGFPRWKLREDPVRGVFRDICQADGTIAASANLKEGTLELLVAPPGADPDPAVSPWEAMSGAALWVDGVLVGVVRSHYRNEGLGRLTATRVGSYLRDPDVDPDRDGLAGLLGLADRSSVVDVLTAYDTPASMAAAGSADAIDLRLSIDAARVRLAGPFGVVEAAHSGLPVAVGQALDRLRWARYTDSTPTRDGGGGGAVAEATSVVGRLLGEQVLPAPVAAAMVDAVADARRRGTPVRLGMSADGSWAGLPWEALWLPRMARPVCLDPLVRVYRQVAAPPVAPSGGPLRILVAIAAPLTGGSRVLDYERELRNVLAAVRGARSAHAQVRIVHFATTREIHDALSGWPAHVLHLSCHGGPGVLELEDDTGAARLVTAQQLVDEAIPAGRMPPVVALAACHTDAATAAGDPSFAAALVASGTGVVIAAQTAITDVYATRVFANLYANLAAASPVDVVTALARARVVVQHVLERDSAAGTRQNTIARLGEWAVLRVLAGARPVLLVDPALPSPAVVDPPAVSGVLQRAPGQLVGRRVEQRRWPAQLLAPSTAGLVLHGVGGVGKTTLADELLARTADLDPSVLVGILQNQCTADQIVDAITDTLADALYAPPYPAWATEPILRALGRAGDGSLGWRRRLTLLATHVLPAAPIVLVLDNFEDNLTFANPDGAREVAGPDLAACVALLANRPGRARLLITSRYRFALPEGAEQALTFRQVGPLSYAETMKLAWALPQLDRLADEDLQQVWRAMGGHPRCLEYLDALLGHGQARFPDVRRRLVAAVTTRLQAEGRPAAAVTAYLSEHEQLDSALAAVAALAADDVLLDTLHGDLSTDPDAQRLLLAASVYRVPVDTNALAFQIGIPDPTADNGPQRDAARKQAEDILAQAGLPSGSATFDQVPEPMRTRIAPLLMIAPTPPVRVEIDLSHLIDLCAATSLLTELVTPNGSRWFVHRWTATELQRRHCTAAGVGDLVAAHLRAADFWHWRVRVWPQTQADDVEDLREAHHHQQQAIDLGDTSANADLAATAWQLEVALDKLGRRAEALTFSQEAVAIKRHLAAEDEAAHIRDLGALLNNLGIRLLNLGRREEALAAAAEAVEVRRRLAAADPDAFEPDLARSLNNLGGMLSNLGRREDALAATSEAVEVRRRLAAANPAAFEPDLATSLTNFGADLSDLGRRAEALAAATEAVEVYRRLAVANPAAFEPGLGTSLNNLGAMLSKLGRRMEALAATTEAVEVRRRLAATNPAAFQPDLAGSLNNLGNRLSNLGRPEEGLAATTDAVEVYRRLAAVNPAAFEPDLAGSLNNLGIRLSNLGRREEGLAATTEAVEVRRRLAATNPAAFEPDLAASLNNLGIRLSELGRWEEGLAATTEAVEVRRRLVAANPAAFEPDLASSLNNFGAMLSRLERWEEGVVAATEAVEVYRRLAAANPAAFEPDLASLLNNLGIRLSELGRRDEALRATAEAVAVYRRLAAANPAAFEPNLAVSLNNLGAVLSVLERREEALTAATEAVEVFATLIAKDFGTFADATRRALAAQAAAFERLDRVDEAIAARRRLDALDAPAILGKEQ